MALSCLTKSLEMISSYTGLGPGGLTIKDNRFAVVQRCIVGSSHGGYAGSNDFLESGQPYDKKNLTSLLGGSGGEAGSRFVCSNLRELIITILLRRMPVGQAVSRFRSDIFFVVATNLHINYTECPQGRPCLGLGRVSSSS